MESFNSFSKSKCFVLFEVIFLFKFLSLSSKSIFFMKEVVSYLLAKFACANVAGNSCAVKFINSCVVI